MKANMIFLVHSKKKKKKDKKRKENFIFVFLQQNCFKSSPILRQKLMRVRQIRLKSVT